LNIQPIVEGSGDVTAVPVLLRRLRDAALLHQVDVNRPIRRNRNQLVREDAVKTVVRLAMLQPKCGAILILFDSDDDCPLDLAPRLHSWAQDEAGAIPCAVVMAHRRGIRDDATSHPCPELPRGAKEELELWMRQARSYHETADQAALSAIFDMGAAYRGCRSFRHLISAFSGLAMSSGTQIKVAWPPADWIAP